ncbi:transposase [Bacillus freudenreichii]|nr:transposase [Bacillus freudenreichii]VEF48544.1 transposase [Bacillus freudenreichii]VEF49415.1 transposase [Bacillus freudenreichii]VEF50050.1 transposase [Bacillus freudenreichii]
MAKYSDAFKLMVVREYLDGRLGYRMLARKYDIKSDTQLKNWVAVYKRYGAAGLNRKKNNEVYSVQFKLDVLSFMKRTGASVTETALQFGLTNPPMIASWKKIFLKGGAEALDRPKGRPSMSDKAKNGKSQKCKKSSEMTREQKLERENELLRLEVEYLKKLRAFQMDPEGYLEKHKQRYHSSSKKISD